MIKISIAHATRRPEQALAIRKLWLESAAHPERIEYIFGIDDDDADSLILLMDEPHTISPPGGGCNRAFNDAAAQCTGDIIIGGCDDFYPFPNWDESICARLPDISLPRVLLTGDGYRSDRLATLMIITRGWYEKFKFLGPPQFTNLGPDVWLTERASRDGCLVDAMELIFEHRHPFYKKAPMDAVYEAQNDKSKHAAVREAMAQLLDPLEISLCLIVGNEARVIERCLNAAQGAFDELCLVRAIGDQATDATEALAREWCAAHGKGFQFAEYRNTRPFPHCDDFAAARNLSFSLAHKFWHLWLDADDVLTEVNCERIREAASNSRFEAQQFRYLTPEGGDFYRERLIKRGVGRWEDPVHEFCRITGNVCQVPQIEVHHAPPAGKERSSARRNLNILEADIRRTPRQVFYYHEELLRMGLDDQALLTGFTALESLPEAMAAERYEVCLNLAMLQPERTPHWAFEAVKIEPARREALALLTQYALHQHDARSAAIYFKWLDCVPAPNPKPWTHQPTWYGWGRDYLRVRVLRLLGKVEQAAQEHAEHLAKDPAYAAGVAAHEAENPCAQMTATV